MRWKDWDLNLKVRLLGEGLIKAMSQKSWKLKVAVS